MSEGISHSSHLMLELTERIVSAYVKRNVTPATGLGRLISDTFLALGGCHPRSPTVLPQPELQPAVIVKKSVTDEYIICLEDGQRFKSMKRHLKAKYDLTPEQYRRKWGLPESYPMVAKSYAEKRSALARANGLGKKISVSPPIGGQIRQTRPKLGLTFR